MSLRGRSINIISHLVVFLYFSWIILKIIVLKLKNLNLSQSLSNFQLQKQNFFLLWLLSFSSNAWTVSNSTGLKWTSMTTDYEYCLRTHSFLTYYLTKCDNTGSTTLTTEIWLFTFYRHLFWFIIYWLSMWTFKLLRSW